MSFVLLMVLSAGTDSAPEIEPWSMKLQRHRFSDHLTIKERRAEYMARHGSREKIDPVDFEPAARSKEKLGFKIKG